MLQAFFQFQLDWWMALRPLYPPLNTQKPEVNDGSSSTDTLSQLRDPFRRMLKCENKDLLVPLLTKVISINEVNL